MSRHRTRSHLLLALASTLLMLGVFEAGFRLRAHLANQGLLGRSLDPVEPPPAGPAELGHMIRPARNRRIVYELKPHLSVLYKGARVTTNAQGFRGVEDSDVGGGDVWRIVGIGDSFMFGQGVADDELYLARLQAFGEAAGDPAGSREWQVINTAVPGYNTVMEVETLKDKGLAYSPDLVIVDFVGNDLSLPNFIRREEPVLALDRSFLVDFFRQRTLRDRGFWQRLEERGLLPAPRNAVRPGHYESDPEKVPPEYRDLVGWDAFRAAMAELRRLRHEHGFEVLWISLQPSPWNKRQAHRLARDLGFHVLDAGGVLRRTFRREGYSDYLRSPLALGPEDGHPSPRAHRIAAETIYAYLLREGLLGTPRQLPDDLQNRAPRTATPTPAADS